MADTSKIYGQLNLQLPVAPATSDPALNKEFTDVYNGVGNLANHAVSNKVNVPWTGSTPNLGDPVNLFTVAGVLTGELAKPTATDAEGFISAIVSGTVEVSMRGLNPYLSGLTPGAKYYVDGTGAYSITPNGNAVGKAFDANTLFFYGISL